MPTFEARLHLPGQTRLPLQVVVDVSDEEILITSGKEQLGVWPLQGVKVESHADGFHLTVDQEEVILNVSDAAGFAQELEKTQAAEDGKQALIAANTAAGVGGKRKGISSRLDGVDPTDRFEDVKGRIAILGEAVTNEAIPPAEFFGRWLRLLKEINRRHGQGAMPTAAFYRLNTELLDLMPAPESTPPPQVVESRQRTAPGPAD